MTIGDHPEPRKGGEVLVTEAFLSVTQIEVLVTEAFLFVTSETTGSRPPIVVFNVFLTALCNIRMICTFVWYNIIVEKRVEQKPQTPPWGF